ncbi:MAG TPA: tRNA (adenosine(37)-N6)-threonylcarbamoyltransferase complex dimerization subunit type 1 TsaB [Hanamia sp.]
MNYLLNIHTTTENAIVNICDGPKVLSSLVNSDSKQHAAFLHTAVHHILQVNDIRPKDLKAIGVTGGPGSYTGIRVGLASAKGFSFALNIPLIMINTLEVMAFTIINKISDESALYCPMIDARRMEVFTAVYDNKLNEIIPPSAMIIAENSFREIMTKQNVYFSGSGSHKFKNIIPHLHDSQFIPDTIDSKSLGIFSWNKLQKKEFENVAHSKPYYIKDFYTIKKNK